MTEPVLGLGEALVETLWANIRRAVNVLYAVGVPDLSLVIFDDSSRYLFPVPRCHFMDATGAVETVACKAEVFNIVVKPVRIDVVNIT